MANVVELMKRTVANFIGEFLDSQNIRKYYLTTGNDVFSSLEHATVKRLIEVTNEVIATKNIDFKFPAEDLWYVMSDNGSYKFRPIIIMGFDFETLMIPNVPKDSPDYEEHKDARERWARMELGLDVALQDMGKAGAVNTVVQGIVDKGIALWDVARDGARSTALQRLFERIVLDNQGQPLFERTQPLSMTLREELAQSIPAGSVDDVTRPAISEFILRFNNDLRRTAQAMSLRFRMVRELCLTAGGPIENTNMLGTAFLNALRVAAGVADNPLFYDSLIASVGLRTIMYQAMDAVRFDGLPRGGSVRRWKEHRAFLMNRGGRGRARDDEDTNDETDDEQGPFGTAQAAGRWGNLLDSASRLARRGTDVVKTVANKARGVANDVERVAAEAGDKAHQAVEVVGHLMDTAGRIVNSVSRI